MLKLLFALPGKWEDEVRHRRAEVLHIGQLFLFFGGFLYFLLPSSILNGEPYYVLITILISVIGSMLLRQGLLQASGIWSISTMWLLFSVGSFTEGGLSSSSFAGTLAMVIFGGLAYGLTASILITVLSITVGALYLYLQSHNLLPPPSITYSQVNIFSDYILYITATSLFTGVAINRIIKSTRKFEAEINERRKAEEQLRSSQDRHQALLEATFEGLVITEQDQVLEVNQQLATMLGSSIDELRGKRIDRLIHPKDLHRITLDYERSNFIPQQIHLMRTEGASFPVEVRTKVFRYQGRDVRLWAIRDLTERVLAEQEKGRLEEQLRHAHKMEAVGRLAGGIAHDFNNLLSAIIGYSEILTMQLPKEDEKHKRVMQIHKAGQRAAALTKQLLAYSRKQALESKLVNMNSIIQDVREMLERTLSEEIALTIQLEPELWNILGDRSQIEQVLINLVINSRDAMEQGGTISIRTTNVILTETHRSEFPGFAPGEYVILSVSDTGKGMDHQTRQNIFEPFFTTKSLGKGTGLGLATAYGVVKQHDGNIFVDSVLGRGTTMTVIIPRTYKTADPEKSRSAPLPKPGTGGTILLVEDEEGVRSFTEEILTLNGYSVLSASSPSIALDLAAGTRQPDLLLSDVILPEMNGKLLYELLKEKLPGLRVLFISGYSNEVIAGRGILNSDDPLLQKPFEVTTLLDRIRDQMNSGH